MIVNLHSDRYLIVTVNLLSNFVLPNLELHTKKFDNASIIITDPAIASHLRKTIKEVSGLSFTSVIIDSNVVLPWIYGQSSEFKQFVADRVKEIHSNS